MNGWFPKINAQENILSGNDGIWLTPKGMLPFQISPVGTSPFWLDELICYNRNDGTTQIGDSVIPKAYNEYYSFGSKWTGWLSNGHVDFYEGTKLVNQADGLYMAKDGFNNSIVYIAPYQFENRTLVYNNEAIFQGKVLKYVLSESGLISWQIATSTYDRQILNQSFIISIRKDEDPIFSFDFLGQTYIVTQAQIGQLIYPLGSHFGYFRPSKLYYPDGLVVDNKLRLVGSDARGNPLFDNYIDLLSPRQDLRLL